MTISKYYSLTFISKECSSALRNLVTPLNFMLSFKPSLQSVANGCLSCKIDLCRIVSQRFYISLKEFSKIDCY